MRFRLRKIVQAAILCVCLVLYINFFILAKGFISVQEGSIGLSFQKEKKIDDAHDELGTKTKSKVAKIEVSKDVYPSLEHYDDDRILTQLKYIPNSVRKQLDAGQEVKLKTILPFGGGGPWGVQPGQTKFLEQKCAVPYCSITVDSKQTDKADVVLFKGAPPTKPLAHQAFVLYLLESPYHTAGIPPHLNDAFNWTATYRHDSTIVAPYERFVPYNASILTKTQSRNFAEGKTKKVAWFVSNCGGRNERQRYAEELKKYIQVDIYGRCGTLHCPRYQSSKCFDMLKKDYKFYLAFENSNCRDYITEKFFINGLKHDVLPIVMGAAPEDYKRAAPPHSFIHVDEFASPKQLAEYLHKLDQNDNLYNEYFQWKGTGDIINTFFWCRVCALAHDTDRKPSWFKDMNAWWRGKDICIDDKSWREYPNRSKIIADLATTGTT